MAKITINGKTLEGTNSIVIINGKIMVDGKDATPNDKVINIEVVGDINKMDIDFCDDITVKGNVNSLKTTSGDIRIEGDVKNGIEATSGDITIEGSVEGDINSTSGDIKCRSISGNASTVSGDISK